MQGERSENTIIAALEKIYSYSHLFDAVAIIRGGGAASDLNCFDSYALAAHVAQFPLPVVSGIGHERDITVLDHVAHTRAKTPTAVAEFFISRLAQTAAELTVLQEKLVTLTRGVLQDELSQIRLLTKEVAHLSSLMLHKEYSMLQKVTDTMQYQLSKLIQQHRHQLYSMEQFVRMASPGHILQRGYTLTTRQGKIITSLEALSPNDEIETHFRWCCPLCGRGSPTSLKSAKSINRIININKTNMEEIGYTNAKKELTEIVSEIEKGTLDVDTLTRKVKRASELIQYCREQLTHTDQELQKILDEIT